MNVVRMIEYCQTDPCYMALELAKAKCLYHYLVATGDTPKGEKWARYFFRQIIEGLSHIHDKGLVHSDIKIDNILLDYTDDG